LGGSFIQIIDNYQDYTQSLIDNFSLVTHLPQIAISIDMLDTGIDIPEILNLVFFKIVRSSTKFWQMIGRGTRLCPAIFGIPENEDDTSKDKKEFLIFDYCDNFEFFGVNPDGFETSMPLSLSQRIMETQVGLAVVLQSSAFQDETHSILLNNLLDKIHQTVMRFNRNSFIVKAALREVDEFSNRERWESLTLADETIIYNQLTPLAEPEDTDEDARRFDLMMLNLMLAFIHEINISAYSIKLKSIAKDLLKKTNLPVVKQKEQLLKTIVSDDLWQNNLSLTTIEQVRTEIRDLIRLLEKESRRIVYSDLKDEIITQKVSDALPDYILSENYKQRVERYIRENEHNPVIQKLKQNIPISQSELQTLENMLFDGKERGSKDDFVKSYGQQPLGKFIRSIVGMDTNAAKEAFSEFLNAGNLSADQIRFVDMIIDYLSDKGVIDAEKLFDVPFTNFHTEGIAGLFDEENTNKILTILHRIDINAAA
jgi:type I restriction enzyme R subunit